MQHDNGTSGATGPENSGPGSKLFLAVGYFASGDTQPSNLQSAFNEHLAQPFFQLKLAGYLRDREGVRKGFLGLLEADDADRADAFLKSSPYFRAGLYDRTEILELDLQVGRLP